MSRSAYVNLKVYVKLTYTFLKFYLEAVKAMKSITFLILASLIFSRAILIFSALSLAFVSS